MAAFPEGRIWISLGCGFRSFWIDLWFWELRKLSLGRRKKSQGLEPTSCLRVCGVDAYSGFKWWPRANTPRLVIAGILCKELNWKNRFPRNHFLPS